MSTKTSTTLVIVVSVVLISMLVTTTIPQNDSVYSVSAQVNNSNNTNSTSMNFAMEELANLHLMIADRHVVSIYGYLPIVLPRFQMLNYPIWGLYLLI
jgi:hypothetical protein